MATPPATRQRKRAPEALIRISHPGVYRRGRRYVAVYRREGRQRKETVGTFAEARQVKVVRQAEARAERLGPTLRVHALDWVDRHAGLGRDTVEGDELVQLASGAIAIVEPETEGAGSEGGEIEVDQSAAPEGIGQPSSLADAESQREEGEFELALAGSEISGTVVAVIAEPWILLANEEIIPAHIEIAPVIEEPNEYIVHYRLELPTGEQAAAVYPVQATAIASVLTGEGGCILRRSPCNEPDLDSASKYAEFWANPNRVVRPMEAYSVYARNPFYENFGANNCTNFISQILRAGGEKWMRWDHSGPEAWWYKRENPWEPKTSSNGMAPRSTAGIGLWRTNFRGSCGSTATCTSIPWTNRGAGPRETSWPRVGSRTGGDQFNHLQYVVGTTIPPGGTRSP